MQEKGKNKYSQSKTDFYLPWKYTDLSVTCECEPKEDTTKMQQQKQKSSFKEKFWL